jgi:hypothetical protein
MDGLSKGNCFWGARTVHKPERKVSKPFRDTLATTDSQISASMATVKLFAKLNSLKRSIDVHGQDSCEVADPG